MIRVGKDDQIETLRRLCDAYEARIAELEKALRFYADKRRYQGPNQHPIPDDPYQPENMRSYMYDTCRDNGELARKALGL